MTRPTTAPYGTWKSPISSDLIVSDVIRLSEPAMDGTDLYWTELRPTEGGRIVLVRRGPDGAITDVTPSGFNVRTRVHEYGGGAYVVRNRTVWFSNFDDQRLYRQTLGSTPVPLTHGSELRWADAVIDESRGRLFCVCEDHSVRDREPVNSIVSLDLHADGSAQVIASGCDFYSNPRLSPDGSRLAWLQWNHPNMPWDGTQLCAAQLDDAGKIQTVEQIAGGVDESVLQPLWSSDAVLYFISDRSGWWNLYRWTGSEIDALMPRASEFAGPPWVFGQASYALESAESLLAVYSESGQAQLTRLNLSSGETHLIETPYSSIGYLRVENGQAVFVGGSPTAPTVIAQLDLASSALKVVRRSSTVAVDTGYVSIPEAIEFPTESDQTAHAFYYAPANTDFRGPAGESPPLLVRSHGGPTSAATRDFNLSIQYWTSRGFAFVDVNYGGSTGYGRKYRNRLRGNWGVVDVDDCINAAQYLAHRKLADPNRLAIDGGSAGGYTTLCALTFRDVFKAGASLYGLSDLVVFVGDTHKFESRYLDSLIGPWPECESLYHARSAINSVAQLSCPIVFFQGDEDQIVPPNQAELMVAALREKGLPVAYVLFEGEQHGFRKAANIKRAIDGEFYFFARIFGFEPADELEPLEIENLD